MTEAQAIRKMQEHPIAFLKKNSITPMQAMDRGNGVSGLHTFYMVDVGRGITRPGTILTSRTRTGQRFKIRPDNIEGGTPFQAFHIPVQASNIHINAIPLNHHIAPVMITTQLTGCSILINYDWQGTVRVAHLQPTDESGQQLQTRLQHPGNRVFGRNDLVGVARGVLIGVYSGRWRFYTQIQDGMFNVLSARELV